MKMIVITAMTHGACRCRMLVPIMKGWRVGLGRMDFPD
jgi:hypothetical protein